MHLLRSCRRTDRFSKGYGVSDTQAKEILEKSKGLRAALLQAEFWPNAAQTAQLAEERLGAVTWPMKGFPGAMHWFEKAGSASPVWNDDAFAAVGTLAHRMMARNQLRSARNNEQVEPPLE